jgi:hypothetical protein
MQRISHPLFLGGISVLVVLAASFFSLPTTENPCISLGGISLPSLCASESVFHVPCPACGLTRGFIACARGEWRRAVSFHRLSPLFFLFVAGLIPWAAFRLVRPAPISTEAAPSWNTIRIVTGLLALLTGNWLLEQLGW